MPVGRARQVAKVFASFFKKKRLLPSCLDLCGTVFSSLRYVCMADLPVTFSGFFTRAAQWTSRQCGRPLTFGLAAMAVVVWAATGPIFHYSDTWQLVINTGTTIVTFLMVFLIQNTQNRESAAVLLKLDELIRASEFARNRLLTLEDLTEDELAELKRGFAKVAQGSEIGVGQVAEGAGA
jgi:low affinity Fe/Cu permease